jgi:hypothetical protein
MADYMNQENASDAMAVSVEQLKKWKDEPWFPKDGYVNGKGYDVEKIKESRTLKPGNSEPVYLINRMKFEAVCPRSPDHRARVHQTVGRIRRCICSDCGHEWQQVGEFANVMAETLNRVAKMLDEAERTEIPDGKGGKVYVVLIEAKAASQAANFCRGAIKAKA